MLCSQVIEHYEFLTLNLSFIITIYLIPTIKRISSQPTNQQLGSCRVNISYDKRGTLPVGNIADIFAEY